MFLNGPRLAGHRWVVRCMLMNCKCVLRPRSMNTCCMQAPDKGLPAPDLVLYLDISIAEAERRGGFGQERYEKRELQQKVPAAFCPPQSLAFHLTCLMPWSTLKASGCTNEWFAHRAVSAAIFASP